MSLKASLSKPYAQWVAKRVMRHAMDAVGAQDKVLRMFHAGAKIRVSGLGLRQLRKMVCKH